MPFVMNGDTKINYVIEGKGDCLVLQHGLYGSIEDWYEFGYVDALKDNYQLILIDARGHGKSDKPHSSEEYTLYNRSLDIIKVLDAQKITKCHYLGYSMGGWISFGLMKWFKERFSSYILNGIHPYENEMLSMHEKVKTLDIWVPQSGMSTSRKQRMLNNDKEALLASVADKREDNSDLLRQIEVPCLMMDGDKDDYFEDIKKSSHLSEMIRFVPIPGADHMGLLAHSELIIPQIKQFLDRIA